MRYVLPLLLFLIFPNNSHAANSCSLIVPFGTPEQVLVDAAYAFGTPSFFCMSGQETIDACGVGAGDIGLRWTASNSGDCDAQVRLVSSCVAAGLTDDDADGICDTPQPVDPCDWPDNGLPYAQVDWVACDVPDPASDGEDENNCLAKSERGDVYRYFQGYGTASYAYTCNAGCALSPASIDTSSSTFIEVSHTYTGSDCGAAEQAEQDATDQAAEEDGISQQTTNTYNETTTITETNVDGSVTTSSTTTTTTVTEGGVGTGTGTQGDGDGDEDATGPGYTDLYEGTGDDWDSVLTDFQASIQGTAIYSGASGFFDVGSLSASCPSYSVNVDVFGTITLDQWCSSVMDPIWPWVQAIFILVCGFFAFRIAILD